MPFVKGQSGNPSGRPKGSAGLAETIRKQTRNFKELVRIMLGIARDGALDRDRVAAVEWLADRGLGRVESASPDGQINLMRLIQVNPVQTIEFEAQTVPTIEIDAKSQVDASAPPSTASPDASGPTISTPPDLNVKP